MSATQRPDCDRYCMAPTGSHHERCPAAQEVTAGPARTGGISDLLDGLEAAAKKATLDIPCITQDPREPAGPEFLAVCTTRADLLSTSVHCRDTGCGGHPICRPCYGLAVREGLAS